jgi:signal transduction histidine kinase
MNDSMHEFATQYAAALEDYLAGGGEVALRTGYELGRQARGYESGLLILTSAHHKALLTALKGRAEHKPSGEIVRQAADFLSECLSPFEMAQRGFQDSIAALRSLNQVMQRQQQDLHLLLSPIPNLLLTVDNRDCVAAFFVPPSFPRILNDFEMGVPLTDVLPDEIEGHIMTALSAVRQSGQNYRLECPMTFNSRMLYFDLQISPVDGSDDVLLVIDNITERKEIQVAEHRQRILAEALRETAIALNSSLDLDEVLNRIVASIGRVVPHDTANIMLIDGRIAQTVRSFGYTDHNLDEYEKAISKLQISPDKTSTLHKVIETKQSTIIPNLTTTSGQMSHLGLGQTGSGICVPILVADSVIGLINLNSFIPAFFTSMHAENLQTFANQAAVAIQNARLFEQAQEAAALLERQRLARDLHDSLSQSLFSASIIAESLPRMWERNPDSVFPLIRDLHQLIKGTAAEMRILLWELRPANLVTTTLDKLLLQLINAVQGRTKMIVTSTTDEIQQLPEDVHVAFYRVAQESLNNIVKHSHATEVNIYLSSKADNVILGIHDNGQGFSLEETASGFGLGNMRERAHLIGASLDLKTQPGKGTEITLTWPRAAGLGKE